MRNRGQGIQSGTVGLCNSVQQGWKPSRRRVAGVLAVLATAMAPVAASAVQVFWDVNGVAAGSGATAPVPPDPIPTYLWSTTDANWNLTADGTGPVLPWSNVGINDAVFSAGNDASGTYTVTLGSNVTANGLVFKDGLAVVAPGSGNVLTLGAGGITSTSTGVQTISAGMVLSAPQTWTNNGTASFALKGPVDNGGHLLTWAGTNTFSPDTAGVISGTGGLTINTNLPGALNFMSAYNTYSGDTTLSGTATTVIATNGTGTPNAPTSGSFGTGTLILNGGPFRGGGAINNVPLNVFNKVTFAADTTLVSGYNLLFSGDVTLTGGTRTLNSLGSSSTSGVLNFAGVIKGNQSFIKTGIGYITLSNANTFGGAGKSFTLDAGGLNINHASALGDAANTFIINGGIINNTSGSAITLANPNPEIWNGDFTFTGANALDLGAAPISLGSAASATRTVTVNGTTAALTIGGVISNGTDAGTPTINLTKAGAGTMVLNGTAANTFTGVTTVTRGTLFLSKPAGVNAVGAGGLAINGVSGTTLVQLTASNQIPDAAPLVVTATGAITAKLDLAGFDETVGSVTMATTGSPGAQITTGGGTLTVGGDLVLNNNRTGSGGASTQVLISGNLNLGGAVRHFTLNGTGDTNANNTLVTVSAVISNGGIIKDGSATNAKVLVLSGNNTYTGGTTINSGNIRFGASDVIPNTGAVNIIAAEGATATLDVLTFNDVIGPLTLGGASTTSKPVIAGSNTTAGTLTLTSDLTYDATNNPLGATINSKLDLGGENRNFAIGDSSSDVADTTITNVISGTSMNITKTGAGTLVIHNSGGTANGFVDTNITAGRLFFSGTSSTNSGRAMGTGVVNVASGTTLGFINTAAFTPTRTINVSSGATLVSRTTTTTLNTSTTTLPTIGTLIFNDDDVATSAITVSGNYPALTGDMLFQLGGNRTGAVGKVTISGIITDGADTRSLTVTSGTGNNSGILLLSGANTFDGGVFIKSGAVNVGNNLALGNAAVPVVVGNTTGSLNATLAISSTSTVANPITVQAGSGAAVITLGGVNATGTSTFSGPVTLQKDVTLTQEVAAGTTVFSGQISGAVNVTKAGAGTVKLTNGANDFGGAGKSITLAGGTLSIDQDSQLGHAANALDFNGGALQVASTYTQNRPITFTGAGTIDVTGTNVLTINTAASGAGGLSKAGSGTLTLTAASTYQGPTAVTTGTLRVDGSIAASSNVTVASGAKFIAGSGQTLKGLTLDDGGAAELASTSLSILKVGDDIAPTPFAMNGSSASVDLHKNVMIVNYPTGSSPITSVRTAIQAAYNGGTWSGVGISSSEVAASVNAAPLLAVGYAESTSLIGGAGTVNFGGVIPTSAVVDASSLIVRTTLSGDADLDGQVNLNDLIRLANNYGTATGLNWSDGDFDYSGGVDLNDLIRLANNYGSNFAAGEVIPAASDTFQADLAAAFNGSAVPTAVPEPGTLGLAAIGAGGLLMRRRRRA